MNLKRALAPFALLSILLSGIVVAHSATAPSPLTIQVVDQRGMPVANAVVEIEVPLGYASPIAFGWRNAMAQHNLAFTPGTLIVAKGSQVAFPNLDSVRHSIYSFSKPARFQIDLYGRDKSRTHAFPIAGTVALGCNIHDQMRGYIRVVDTPYAAKTDVNGLAQMPSVPHGNFQMVVWHPDARLPGGELKAPLTVRGTGATQRFVLPLR